jgi:hypothetical protein
VLVRRYDLGFKPWDSWAHGNNPAWWRGYNNVKHQRDIYFHEANLENYANAVSGLFVAMIYCYKAEKSTDALEPYPVLLDREQEPGHLLLESDYAVPDFTWGGRA